MRQEAPGVWLELIDTQLHGLGNQPGTSWYTVHEFGRGTAGEIGDTERRGSAVFHTAKTRVLQTPTSKYFSSI